MAVAEVAQYLNCSRGQVNALLDRGEMLSFAIGRRRVVPVDEVRAFVDRSLADVQREFVLSLTG
jgi:excisionase family DNA binding protein